MKVWCSLRDAWYEIWFQNKNTLPLEVVRLGLGCLMFFNYALLLPSDVVALYADSGLFDRAVVPEMNQFYSFSWFVYFEKDWQALTFHYVFVSLCFLFFIGWQTRWVKWLVLLGHLSYFNRNEFLFYGVDSVLIAVLIPLCIAPIGQALSLDRIRQVRRYKDTVNVSARPELATSQRGFACQRLIQVQMAAIYFTAGIEKLYGAAWWLGDAPWIAMVNNQTAFSLLGLFAPHYWIINLMAFGTILIEIAYPFLIWGRKSRPYLLVAALLLHLGIAVFLGIVYFSAVMAFGHLAFMRREWYASAGQWWRNRIGSLEMIYDGDCGFCKRSMTFFLAFDGLNQIQTRNYRVNPSPIVSSEKVDLALYAITADQRAIPGFDAYRHVVLRVPGMWWLVPLFYIPVLSRGIGRPVYYWVATHRMQLSRFFFKPKPGSVCRK